MAEDNKRSLTVEQELVVQNKKKKLVVSASAGSGKTFVVVEKLINLICKENIPVSRLLVLTFTKAAANELKTRLYSEILNQKATPFLIEQLDDILISDISTIDSFCEKIIKRNINKLSLAQNFAILDEKSSKRLKNNAFNRAIEKFSNEKSEIFEDIYFAFKRNSDMLFECVQTIQNFFDSENDGELLKENFSKNLLQYHEKACKNLKEKIQSAVYKSLKILDEAVLENDMLGEKLAKGHLQFIENLKSILALDFNCDFFTLCKNLTMLALPPLSTAKCDKSVKEKFARAKDKASLAYNIALNFKNAKEKFIEDAQKGKLAAQILEFYNEYENQYQILKEKRSALDFADLEKYAKFLLQDDEVRSALQDRYDYIIIDEYQDTNRLQEGILKPIAEKGHFIAVGDIKQGIYGFRNANKEIMSQDIENFSNSEDGQALFLRGNFRTDEKILSFVNDIFEKIMTPQSVGIDYKNTSMLEGKNKFIGNSLPAVRVDIVCPSINQEAEDEKESDEWKDVYSVKEDNIETSFAFKEEITLIAHRIEEVLKEKIYIPKLKEFRNVEQGDIALLFRNRSPLMKECAEFLQAKGFSVNADIKENLLEDSQISLICSLIKLSININDDISLASCMASPFGNFSLQQLADFREESENENFYEIIKKSEQKQVKEFLEKVEEFKFNIQVFGIVKALEMMFLKTNYRDYINSLTDSEIKNQHINKLFALIKSNNLDFSPQELLSTLENSNKENKVSLDGGNSITITTIHATKGLEYPIVFICGAGDSLSSIYNKNHIITKEFGLGSYLYSVEDNFKMASPAFVAGKLCKKEKEFVDELMLFYVAMTRAQNHLYIIGKGKEKDFTFTELAKQNSYLKLIFFALGGNLTSQIFSQEELSTNNVTYSVITEIEDSKQSKEDLMAIEKEEKIEKEIKDYFAFQYKNKNQCKLSYKNSVTGVMKLENEYNVGETLYIEENEESKIDLSQEEKLAREKAVEIGNSYHEALKLVDFENVSSLSDLEIEFEKIKPIMSENYSDNINLNILLENILLLKNVVGNNKTYKEKEFIMECYPQEVGFIEEDFSLLNSEENSLIVQGIIDLFAIGDRLILIDYKYSSIKDQSRLIERYKGQIDLYQKALEKAFKRKVDEKYLLSIKQAKLIKIN